MTEPADAPLLRQLSEARAWARSEYHRYYDAHWLSVRDSPDDAGGWEWVVPGWLSSDVEPHHQPWFVAPPAAGHHAKPEGGC